MLFFWLTQLAHQGLYKLAAQNFAIASENPLTQREVEVLRWSAEGKSAHEITTKMGITERTVNFHTIMRCKKRVLTIKQRRRLRLYYCGGFNEIAI